MTKQAPKIKLDPEDLTLDELEEFEEIMGDFGGAFGKKAKKAPAMKALAYLFLKRDDPTITLEQAGKAKLSQFDIDEDVDAEAAGKGE